MTIIIPKDKCSIAPQFSALIRMFIRMGATNPLISFGSLLVRFFLRFHSNIFKATQMRTKAIPALQIIIESRDRLIFVDITFHK